MPSLKLQYTPVASPIANSLVKTIYLRPDGNPVCSAKRQSCRQCDRRYPEEEYNLDECPDCGEPRYCCETVPEPGLRCKFHGGKSLKGSASPRFVSGRWSKYMPLHLLEKYHEAAQDTELLAVRQDIAMLDARIADLLGRVDTGLSAEIFEEAGKALNAYKTAKAAHDAVNAKVHMRTLEQLIFKGKTDYAAWEDVRRLMEQRRKLIETEMRRLEKMQQFITAEEVAALISAIGHTAKRVIKDPQVLNEFTTELLSLGR